MEHITDAANNLGNTIKDTAAEHIGDATGKLIEAGINSVNSAHSTPFGGLKEFAMATGKQVGQHVADRISGKYVPDTTSLWAQQERRHAYNLQQGWDDGPNPYIPGTDVKKELTR